MLAVIGIMGNLLVIIGIIRLRKKATVTDILVANLAAADFLFTAFCPIWAMERFRHGEWIMGEVMCQVATFIRLFRQAHPNLFKYSFFLVC